MPSLCSIEWARASLRRPSEPSAFGRNLGMRKSERPFDPGGVDRMRQTLAAPLHRCGKPVPASLRPSVIGLLPSRCRGHGAVFEPRALAVTDHIEGSQDVGRELACFCKYRLDHVGGEI